MGICLSTRFERRDLACAVARRIIVSKVRTVIGASLSLVALHIVVSKRNIDLADAVGRFFGEDGFYSRLGVLDIFLDEGNAEDFYFLVEPRPVVTVTPAWNI